MFCFTSAGAWLACEVVRQAEAMRPAPSCCPGVSLGQGPSRGRGAGASGVSGFLEADVLSCCRAPSENLAQVSRLSEKIMALNELHVLTVRFKQKFPPARRRAPQRPWKAVRGKACLLLVMWVTNLARFQLKTIWTLEGFFSTLK